MFEVDHKESASAPTARTKATPETRQVGITHLQRLAGNRAVTAMIQGARSARALPVQRHQENAVQRVKPLGSDSGPETLQNDASPCPTDQDIDSDVPPPPPDEDWEAPTPISDHTMSAAFAQHAITKTYGLTLRQPVTHGPITIVNSLAELCAEWDKDAIQKNETNPRTKKPWALGDKYAECMATRWALRGFAAGDRIWIDATGPDPTVLVHEMLHVNSDRAFDRFANTVIREGLTQRLAIEAVQSTGRPVDGAQSTYPSEQAFVVELAQHLGMETLKAAYFGGYGLLLKAANEIFGLVWSDIEYYLGTVTPPAYDSARELLKPKSQGPRADKPADGASASPADPSSAH